MKSHERRILGAYPYYALAKWSTKSICWKDTKKVFNSIKEAKTFAAKKHGKYRIAEVTETERKDMPPFEIL